MIVRDATPNARFLIRGHQIPTLLYTPRTIAALLVQGHKVEIGRLCQQPEISRFMFRGEGWHLEAQPYGVTQIPSAQRRLKVGLSSFCRSGADRLRSQVPAGIIQSVHGDIQTQLPTGWRL